MNVARREASAAIVGKTCQWGKCASVTTSLCAAGGGQQAACAAASIRLLCQPNCRSASKGCAVPWCTALRWAQGGLSIANPSPISSCMGGCHTAPTVSDPVPLNASSPRLKDQPPTEMSVLRSGLRDLSPCGAEGWSGEVMASLLCANPRLYSHHCPAQHPETTFAAEGPMYAQTAAGVHAQTLANVQACTLQLRHCTDWALACSSAIISGAFFSTSAISNVVLSILAKACSRVGGWVVGWVGEAGGWAQLLGKS